MNDDQYYRALVALDGQIVDNIALAEKAMEAGKFEKATAYATIATAQQRERAWLAMQKRGLV